MVLCLHQCVCMPHLKRVGDFPDWHQEAAGPAAAGLLLIVDLRLDEGLPQGTVVAGLAAAPVHRAWGQERPRPVKCVATSACGGTSSVCAWSMGSRAPMPRPQ